MPIPVTQRNIQSPENFLVALELQATLASPNADSDGDGILDVSDNSPLVFNPDPLMQTGMVLEMYLMIMTTMEYGIHLTIVMTLR